MTALSFAAIIASDCSSDDDNDTSDTSDMTDTTETTDTTDTADTSDGSNGTTSLDPTLFVEGALVSDPAIIDCTLSDGTETTCYEIVTVGVPADSAVGPFCPQNIDTTAADSGNWRYLEWRTAGSCCTRGCHTECLHDRCF